MYPLKLQNECKNQFTNNKKKQKKFLLDTKLISEEIDFVTQTVLEKKLWQHFNSVSVKFCVVIKL